MPSRAVAVLLAVSLTVPSLLAAPSPTPSAPILGPEKYTVHLSGTVKDVIPALAKATGRNLRLDDYDAPLPPHLLTTAVSLSFDNAPLTDILLSLCRQAGLTYDLFWGGPYGVILLYPGDPLADCRPTAVLDDYILRVTKIALDRHRQAFLRRGPIPADKRPHTSGVTLSLSVEPRTAAAYASLAGLRAEARAVFDVGAPVQSPAGPPLPLGYPLQVDTWRRSVPALGRLTLPLPDPRAKVLTRLDGALVLLPEIVRTDFRLPRDSKGKSFTRDGISLVVRNWQRGGFPGYPNDADTLHVQVDVTYQPLHPPVDYDPFKPGHDGVAARLLAPDDDHLESTSGGFSGKEGNLQIMFDFPLTRHVFDGHSTKTEPPLEPEAVLVTVTRVGLADKTVPFVLTNVPLP